VISVLDNETATLSVELPESVTENSGVLTNAGTVRVSQAVDADVTVALSSSDTTELIVPATVVVPAGAVSAAFDFIVIDDGLPDGEVPVYVTASVEGWESGSAATAVRDTPCFAAFNWSGIPSPQSRNEPIPITLTALDQFGEVFASFSGPVSLEAIAFSSLPRQQDIGTGTEAWNYPMSTFYHDARTQVIYLNTEMGGEGTITSLSLQVVAKPGQTLNNWTIRMRHTSLSEYPASPVWESDWTTVYQSNTVISATGWTVFTLSSPFEYNGIDNLMVDFSHNNSSYTTDGTCAATTMGSCRSVTFRTDSGYGDPAGWPANGYNPPPARSVNVPNVRLAVNGSSQAISMTPSMVPEFVQGVWNGAITVSETGSSVRVIAVTSDETRWESAIFDVIESHPGSFVYWLAERGLFGDQATLFGQPSPESGVPYGLLYAFGGTPGEPLLNIRWIDGRPVVEIPVQDAATLPYAEVRVVGSTNLTDWSLPVVPAADTAGKPADRAWHEPEGSRPSKAFFKLEAELK
jgi:hypothetical protein